MIDRSWIPISSHSKTGKWKDVSTAICSMNKKGQFPYFFLRNMVSTYCDYFVYISIKKGGFCIHKQQKLLYVCRGQTSTLSSVYFDQKFSSFLIYRRKESKIPQNLITTRSHICTRILWYTFPSSWLLTIQQLLIFFTVYTVFQI